MLRGRTAGLTVASTARAAAGLLSTTTAGVMSTAALGGSGGTGLGLGLKPGLPGPSTGAGTGLTSLSEQQQPPEHFMLSSHLIPFLTWAMKNNR